MADVILMTATPFRADRKELDGKIIYQKCSVRRAIVEKFVKNVVFEPVPITRLTGKDENGKPFVIEGAQKMIGESRYLGLCSLNQPTS